MNKILGKAMKYRDNTWDFRTANTKPYTHCFHSYPAMMIPQVAGRVLDEFGKNAKILFDPYCGTGTSLVEANIRNIDAIGTDINPLARLIAKVKTTVISLELLDTYLKDFNQSRCIINNGSKSCLESVDIVLTSPPYGDSRTTVASLMLFPKQMVVNRFVQTSFCEFSI